MEPQTHFPKKIFIAVVIIIVLVTVVFVGQKFLVKKAPLTKENVTVKQEVINPDGLSKIPAGFPVDIPVNTADVIESYTATYPDRGVTQSTVSFGTTNPVDRAFAKYSVYMSNAGFVFTQDGNNEKTGFIQGTKNNNVLSMVIKSVNDKTLIQMTYLEMTKK